MPASPDKGLATAPGRSGIRRSVILFTNFFLIILAYYQIKPASRSIAIEFVGADNLPFIWIGTAIVLGSIISYYHRLVERHRRVHIMLGTCLTFIAVLIVFHLILDEGGAASAVARERNQELCAGLATGAASAAGSSSAASRARQATSSSS